MERYGVDKNYFKPDISNEHNYMLDTCIFNKLCYNESVILKLEKSLDYGYKYFYTNIQIREMAGYKDIGDKLIRISSEEIENKKREFEKIISKLDLKIIGYMGVLSVDTFILDGSCYLCSNEYVEFAKSVRKGNMKHNEDMIIAESAIHQGCILVTNDKTLLKKVRKTYFDKAINLEELLHRIDTL